MLCGYFLFILSWFFCFVNTLTIPGTTSVNGLTSGLSDFSKEFYWRCTQSTPGNIIVSPLSVANALALLSQGAKGSTFEELRYGLHLNGDKTTIANQFLEYNNLLKKSAGKSTLLIANGIFVLQNQKLNRNFQNVAVSKFESIAMMLKFRDRVNSVRIINRFVAVKTNGKIKDLYKPNDVGSDTSSVLVNAIYFKGNWEHKFKPEYTRKRHFNINNSEKVSIDFMHTTHKFRYTYDLTDLDASALEMKYANSNLSFLIVLPNNLMGLQALEKKLKNYDLGEIIARLETNDEIDVAIPKFKIEYEIQLNDALSKMGMSKMFTENADFSGMTTNKTKLKVSDVIHKAFIEISEEGSEAAAVTGIEIASYFGPPTFEVDHPFAFFIRDSQTNTTIFSGRIENFN